MKNPNAIKHIWLDFGETLVFTKDGPHNSFREVLKLAENL
jgi:hypothetical protein